MNSGQMLITMAAMMLLSTVILSVNKRSLNTSTEMSEAKYQIMAVSLANTIIEEAFNKSFDEETIGTTSINKEKDLSINLRPDAGENSRSNFDDFDDFNRYHESLIPDSTQAFVPMEINCRVFYVDPFLSLDSVNYNTWHKRITVTVTSPYIGDGKRKITLSKINSHYYFR